MIDRILTNLVAIFDVYWFDVYVFRNNCTRLRLRQNVKTCFTMCSRTLLSSLWRLYKHIS